MDRKQLNTFKRIRQGLWVGSAAGFVGALLLYVRGRDTTYDCVVALTVTGSMFGICAVLLRTRFLSFFDWSRRENRTARRVAPLPVIFVLLIASFLRLHRLGGESLWFDELVSWLVTFRFSVCNVYGWLPMNDAHLFDLSVLGITRTLGDAEFLLRWPSAMAGMIAVASMYSVGRRLYGHRAGVIAAIFMTIGWAPLRYSQEARSYSYLLAFSLLSMHAWLALLKDAQSIKRLPVNHAVLYVASMALAAYSHYFSLILIALQTVYILIAFWKRKTIRQGMILIYAFFGTIYMHALPPMLSTLKTILMSYSPAAAASQSSSLARYVVDLVAFSFNRSDWIAIGIIAVWTASLTVSWFLTRKQSINTGNIFSDQLVLLWLLAPVLLIYIITLVTHVTVVDLLRPRYVIYVIPAIYLLTARSIDWLRPDWLANGTAFIASTGLLFSLIWGVHYYTESARPDWRSAFEITARSDLGDDTIPIITSAYDGAGEVYAYYLRQWDETRIVPDLTLATGQDEANRERLVEYLREEQPASVWVVLPDDEPLDDFYAVFTANGYTLKLSQSAAHLEIWQVTKQ
ncbi:MAG: glycosyltransferase family 39 protein [Anaerolineae bacterium]|nr:glycosyltransferase family 39 protein [Anaerolineae bacterium]